MQLVYNLNWHLLVKVNNGNTRTICEICSKLIDAVIDIVLVYLFLTFGGFQTLF